MGPAVGGYLTHRPSAAATLSGERCEAPAARYRRCAVRAGGRAGHPCTGLSRFAEAHRNDAPPSARCLGRCGRRRSLDGYLCHPLAGSDPQADAVRDRGTRGRVFSRQLQQARSHFAGWHAHRLQHCCSWDAANRQHQCSGLRCSIYGRSASWNRSASKMFQMALRHFFLRTAVGWRSW